jgi:hypothetical protein
VAVLMKKTPRQCRDHWGWLEQSIVRQWTDKEEASIVELGNIHGGKWAMVARVLSNGRSAGQIRNRYNCLIKANPSLAFLQPKDVLPELSEPEELMDLGSDFEFAQDLEDS